MAARPAEWIRWSWRQRRIARLAKLLGFMAIERGINQAGECAKPQGLPFGHASGGGGGGGSGGGRG